MKAALLLFCLPLCGCSFLQRHGFIKAGNVVVEGFKDAGKPATLATSEAGSVMALPEGTTFVQTKFEATPFLMGANGQVSQAAQPARTVTEVHLTKPSELRTTESKVDANTGTVDTTLASHKADLAASEPLLYAAIVSGIAAMACLYFKYPTPAAMCGGAMLVFLVAWKVSSAPPWLWALGLVGLAAAAALWVGHERGLYTPVPAKEP